MTLTGGFMKGKYAPGEVKMKNGFKKMAARMRSPSTVRVSITRPEEASEQACRCHSKKELEPLPDDELIRLTELMHCVPMTHMTMNKMIGLGAFPKPHKKVGRSRLWKTKDVQGWLDKLDNLNLAKD